MKQIIKITLALLLITAMNNSYSQTEPFHQSYDWEEKPNYKVTVSDSTGKIIYKSKIVKEFIFTEEKNLTEYSLSHQIVWLNSDQEIEKNNKIYLPFSNSSQLIVNKARVITKEGKVIDLDEDNIQTAEDEDGQQMYKYFTFEGLEKGSFIEYISVYRKYPRYKGSKLSLQNTYTKYNVEFDLYAPTNLGFEFKSYNGLEPVMRDTIIEDKAHWSISVDTLPGLDRESRSPYHAVKQFLVYKLDKNYSANISDISSYGTSASNTYNYLYGKTSKKDVKAVNKLIKSSGVNAIKGNANKIRSLEDYIKKNVNIIKNYREEFSTIPYMVKHKVANENGIIKLYALAYKQIDVKTQLVITSDRTDTKFDEDFEATNFLTDYMLYFPSTKSFMSPSDITSRVGFPPSHLTDNFGLFVKEVSLGEFSTGVGKIKYIKSVDHKENYNDIIVEVTFDAEDISNTTLNIDHSKGGYYANSYQTIFHLVDDETRKELIDEQINFINENLKDFDAKVYNDNAESFGNKPLRVTAEVTTDVFVEKAGPKYLFKVGELIGPQMEMYQEKKRVLPIDTRFANMYHRTISFTIPEGYVIKNLDDLNISNETKNEDGEVIYKFETSYTQEGDKVTVTGIEFYKPVVIETELYEEYRKVMNSAADFNKVTLILEAK